MQLLYSAITLGLTLSLIGLGWSLLPDANGIPTGIDTAIQAIVHYMQVFNFLLDFNTLMIVVSVIMFTEGIILGWKALSAVFRFLFRTGN